MLKWCCCTLWILLGNLVIACTFDVTGLPGNDPQLCGNGKLDPGEICDGQHFATTCREQGYIGGFLLCRPDCSMDASRCIAGCGECVPGSRRCLDNQVFECTEYGQGCGMWTFAQDCSTTHEWCREDESEVTCRATCIDQCEENQRVCTASGKLEGCREVMATDIQICWIWQTLAVCTQGCEDLPVPRCTDPCVDACEEGTERCSLNRSKREICQVGYFGCLTWMDMFPYCIPGREICETFDNLTLCGCHLCESGEQRCSADLTKVLECVADNNECTTWKTKMDCDLLGSFARCSEIDNYQCVPYGDTCSAILPINPSPTFSASTDHFNNFFNNTTNFTDPTCGTTIDNAPEAFAAIHLARAETVRCRQTNSDGPLVRWRIQQENLCGGNFSCLAFADNTLVYTSFVDQTVAISAEVDWSSSYIDTGVNLVIERIPNGCTDVETEPNDGFSTANTLSVQALETWGFCSALSPRFPDVSDVDCMAVTLPSPGRRIEIRATALDGNDTCLSDLLLRMYRTDGMLIATSAQPAPSPLCARIAPDETDMEPLVALPPGTYKICVSRNPGQVADVITRITMNPPPATPLSTNFSNCLPSNWQVNPPDAWSCNSSNRFMSANVTGDQTGLFSLYSAPVDMMGYQYGVLQFNYFFNTNNPNARLRVVYSTDNFGTSHSLIEYSHTTSGRLMTYLAVGEIVNAGNAVRIGFELDIPSARSDSSTQVEIDDVILYVW